MEHGHVHSEIVTYFYICYSSIMFVYYINFSCKEKSYCFFLGASVPSLIFLLAVIFRDRGVRSGVLGSEIRSAQHTRLLAANADAACSHCNVLVLYRTRTILYDTCLMDAGRIFDRI